MSVLQKAEEYYSFAVDMRREFHTNPELSNREFDTTRRIKEELERLGIPILCPAPTGVIAVINGNGPGKTVALRGDIDALPIQELNDVPYRSQTEGVMHACGHDAHGAALLAAAKCLRDLRDSFSGTVKLIFQPAEEYFPSGALAMMSGGDLDDVTAFFGIHNNPNIPTGKVSLEAGPRMAASASVDITVKGKGGHGGLPHQCVDATVAAAAIIMNLQTLASRELSADNPAVVSIGSMNAGTAKNIIAEEAVLSGTCRYFDPDLEEVLREKISRIAHHTAQAFRAEAETVITPGLPPVINDSHLTAIAAKSAADLWGDDCFFEMSKQRGCEDFAYYAKIAPSVFAYCGAWNPANGEPHPAHNPRFDIDERELFYATALYTQFALDYLNS